MNWTPITEIGQIESLKNETSPILIFKHSTTCSISATALDRFQRNWDKISTHKNLKPYYLDLLNHRDISKKIAQTFDIEHESPQALLIINGKCVYSESHFGIAIDDILEAIN